MKFIYEKISIPNKHTFITRRTKLIPGSEKIHSHKNFELNLILSGSGRRIVGNNISSYSKGDLVLLAPNISHCWEVLDYENNTDPECIVTHFDENFISSDFLNIPELETLIPLLKDAENGIVFKGVKSKEIATILKKMTSLNGLDLLIHLLQVFNLLLQIEDIEYLTLPSSLPNSYKKDQDKINKVYEYVFQNIQDGTKLKEAASILYLQPSSFCRYFKKKTNQSFMEYVKDVRIGMAAKLLAETNKQITEICFECGYNNLANFNHYFKVIMNKTPSAYRKDFR